MQKKRDSRHDKDSLRDEDRNSGNGDELKVPPLRDFGKLLGERDGDVPCFMSLYHPPSPFP